MDTNWRMARRLTWRWSIMSTALLAAFWSAWFLVNGSVPTEHLSRWADIAIGPIWSVAAVLIRLAFEQREDQLIVAGSIAWFLSLLCALSMGLVTGLLVMVVVVGTFTAIYLLAFMVWLLMLAWQLLPGSRAVSRWLSGE